VAGNLLSCRQIMTFERPVKAPPPAWTHRHDAHDRDIATRAHHLAAGQCLSDQTGQVCHGIVDRKLSDTMTPWLDV
jgi:hypothetical protein